MCKYSESSPPNMLDLRMMLPELVTLLIEVRASLVEANGSFWIICDHDPVELYDFFVELGFTIQTFIYSPKEYRVFLGRI